MRIAFSHIFWILGLSKASFNNFGTCPQIWCLKATAFIIFSTPILFNLSLCWERSKYIIGKWFSYQIILKQLSVISIASFRLLTCAICLVWFLRPLLLISIVPSDNILIIAIVTVMPFFCFLTCHETIGDANRRIWILLHHIVTHILCF